MSDRIDHAAMAESRLSLAVNDNREEFVPVAQVHATLALVEQQRIANLIALAHVADQHESVSPAEQQAWETLGVRGPGTLRPDIAAALGVGR